jgi:ectoine hydroxylase-related dioxygenase (phytanoyl-CoA dioxygenase family)
VIDENGFAVVEKILDDAACDSLAAELTVPGRRGGTRRALDIPIVQAVASCPAVVELVGSATIPVRATFFDKTSEANWKVAWHQDRMVAMAERVDHWGFGPWREKEGMWHVEPPLEFLERTLAVRLHIDACGAENGPLRVIAGTHRLGKLSAERIAALVAKSTPEDICVGRGGALVMRPLLLHASSAAIHPSHRRVLHIEYR